MYEAMMLSGMKNVDIRILNDLLILFPDYGEFDFTVFIGRYMVTLLEVYTIKEGPNLINADKTIYFFLVSQGFLKRRSAGSLDHKVVELTDKGRRLKDCGSVNKYIIWEKQEKERDEKRMKLSDRLVENNLSNGMITRRLYLTNLWIAAGTGVAALFYSREILKSYIHLTMDMKSCWILLFFGICIGITISGLIQELVKRRTK